MRLGAGLGGNVGAGDGADVGMRLGAGLGGNVGAGAGAAVGTLIGAGLGGNVGASVGAAVIVGAAVVSHSNVTARSLAPPPMRSLHVTSPHGNASPP